MVISERNTQIASVVMVNHLTVVTHTVKVFGRIDKLKAEDWEMKLQKDLMARKPRAVLSLGYACEFPSSLEIPHAEVFVYSD